MGMESNFSGYEALKSYIRARDLFLDALRALGYQDSRQTKDATLMDHLKEFIDSLPPETQEYVLPEYDRLCLLRWDTYIQLKPLVERYLRGRGYKNSKDPTGEIKIYMYMALEKAMDQARLPNMKYLYSWLRPTWENAIRRTHCLIDQDGDDNKTPPKKNVQHAAFQRRELPVVFGDAYSDETEFTLNPIDEQTPETYVLENELDPKAVLNQVIREAQNIGETAVVEYMLQLKREIEQKGRMPRLRKNSLELAKIRALLLAQGLSPDMLC